VNILRCILGIPIAFSILVGLAFLSSNFERTIVNNPFYRHVGLYYHAFVNLLCFIYIFLSTLFIPSNRKYAAVIATCIGFAFVLTDMCYTFIERRVYGDITFRLLVSYAGIFAGISTGFYVSYEFFKTRNWSAPKKIKEDIEVY